MIFPPPPPAQGLAHGLEIKRARYSPAMHLQQTQFFLINNLAMSAQALRAPCSMALTIELAAFG
jgi:hypothetical protein